MLWGVCEDANVSRDHGPLLADVAVHDPTLPLQINGSIPLDQTTRRRRAMHTMLVARTGRGKTRLLRSRLSVLQPHFGEDCEVYMITSSDTWASNQAVFADMLPDDHVYLIGDDQHWWSSERSPEDLLKATWARADGNDRMFIVIFDDVATELGGGEFGATLQKFLVNGRHRCLMVMTSVQSPFTDHTGIAVKIRDNMVSTETIGAEYLRHFADSTRPM